MKAEVRSRLTADQRIKLADEAMARDPSTLTVEAARADMAHLNWLHADLTRREARAQKTIDALGGLGAWIERKPLVLQNNLQSRFHHLQEAMIQGRMIGAGYEELDQEAATSWDSSNVFVVRHDWAAALGETIESSEVRLPYPVCVFEFQISGHCVILLAAQQEGEQPICTPFVQCGDLWYAGGADDVVRLEMPWRQVAAICVALDAEVATHSVVRASSALNRKRERSGKIAIKDFHIIDLSKRHRVSNPVATETGVRRRLHFRRGHWRHYETYKTWIKWMLVGDPDLGFVDKSYRI